jgi:hypothetical protein
MSRVRAVAEGCAEPDPEVTTAALRRFGRRQAIWIAAVLLAAFGLAAWQSGYIDRILSRDPERIKVDTGPFGEDLAVVLDNTWGNYEVTRRRGPSYPTTEEAITKRREAAADLPHRAALGILSEGGTIYVQLRDGSGNVLASAAVELRALLGSTDGEVVVKLPGRIAARSVRLDLERGLRR